MITMVTLQVKIGQEFVEIDKSVFEDLLDLTPIKEYKDYNDAIEKKEITLSKLKSIAQKAGVPYPLFFASTRISKIQLNYKDKNIFEKMPKKDEIRIGARGGLMMKDISMIIQDLGRKQEFLKRRVLQKAKANDFMGSLVKRIKNADSTSNIANELRKKFLIDLPYLRTLTKGNVLNYLRTCIEKQGILVSFSSHNYMPQNLDRELEVSGLCIKDAKFPYIFINTRDGDDNPKIIESDGRQIFTLLSMLVCVGMNEFILSAKSEKSGNRIAKKAFEIASEIIIPHTDLSNISIIDLDNLREKAHYFQVTPSMLLYQLERHRKISAEQIEQFRIQLAIDLKKIEPKHRRAPLPVTGYSKYNGDRFSREVIRAHMLNQVSQLEVRNILFRRGKKMDDKVWSKYMQKFRPVV